MLSQDIILVEEVTHPSKIKEAILATFYAPEKEILEFVAEELSNYFRKSFQEKRENIKVFVAYEDESPVGFISAMLNPAYTSNGFSCGTIGYLNVKNQEIIEGLISNAENFLKSIGVKKVRACVNFPKGLGGTGILLEDKKDFPMYGVPLFDPNIDYIGRLEGLKYKQKSLYHSVHVKEMVWKNIKKISGTRFGYLSMEEIYQRREEILEIAYSRFSGFLPDTSGSDDRILELLNIYSKVPDSFYTIRDNFDPREYVEIPEIVEAIENFDPKEQTLFAGFAFDKGTDEIIAVALSIPNLYQMCCGKPITEVNADTMMVKKGFDGRGLFAGINAMGQLIFKRYGISYVEGTTIWDKSERIMSKIVPFTDVVRKYVVLQKRLRS